VHSSDWHTGPGCNPPVFSGRTPLRPPARRPRFRSVGCGHQRPGRDRPDSPVGVPPFAGYTGDPPPGVGLWRSHRRTCCLSRALILVPRTDCMYLASRTMTGRAPRPVKLSEPGPSGKCPYAPPGDVAIHGPRWCPQLESEQDDLALLLVVPGVAAAGAKWAIPQHPCSVRVHQSAEAVPDGTLGPTKSIGGPLVRTALRSRLGGTAGSSALSHRSKKSRAWASRSSSGEALVYVPVTPKLPSAWPA
jgi:hypothetical protein